jgi:hypothetical protein
MPRVNAAESGEPRHANAVKRSRSLQRRIKTRLVAQTTRTLTAISCP